MHVVEEHVSVYILLDGQTIYTHRLSLTPKVHQTYIHIYIITTGDDRPTGPQSCNSMQTTTNKRDIYIYGHIIYKNKHKRQQSAARDLNPIKQYKHVMRFPVVDVHLYPKINDDFYLRKHIIVHTEN